jgi:hypothetical protein
MGLRIGPDPATLDEAIAGLALLAATYRGELATVREQLPELRRNARANAKRRGSSRGSPDELKYRFGSVLYVLDAVAVDDVALLGLLFNADIALGWLARARLERGPCGFFKLVEAILAEPFRRNWCRRWGEVVTWERNRDLYLATVESFLKSGKADDPKARWRSKHPTSDQLELIDTICTLTSLAPPEHPNRGEAFEWIRREGGNPRYWEPPAQPPKWGHGDGA